MENRYPYGYGTTVLTWDEMMTKATVYRLHPEVRRRLKALLEGAAANGLPLGVGTGWRIQPVNKPGFASPGNSWHESCPVNPSSPTAVAIDTVPATSWPWMQINCGKYGFRTFKYVNNEPWHIQPVEFPTSRGWKTVLPPLQTYNLPGQPSQPIPVPPQPTPTPPVGTFVISLNKTLLTPENRAQVKGNDDVLLVQCVALGLYAFSGNEDFNCGKPDKDYGPRTQKAVVLMQRLNRLEPDAKCGPKTWTAILNEDGK